MIGWLLCKVKGHAFRRARKGEIQALKYCKRCGAGIAVKTRAPRVPRT